jgi:hypothetical protein
MDEADNLKNNEGNEVLACVKGSFIVLYNDGEYEIITGTFDETIQYVKADRRYNNYGHKGATIVGYRKMYTINDESVERTFV